MVNVTITILVYIKWFDKGTGWGRKMSYGAWKETCVGMCFCIIRDTVTSLSHSLLHGHLVLSQHQARWCLHLVTWSRPSFLKELRPSQPSQCDVVASWIFIRYRCREAGHKIPLIIRKDFSHPSHNTFFPACLVINRDQDARGSISFNSVEPLLCQLVDASLLWVRQSLSNQSLNLVTGRKGFVRRSLNGSQVKVEVVTSSEE